MQAPSARPKEISPEDGPVTARGGKCLPGLMCHCGHPVPFSCTKFLAFLFVQRSVKPPIFHPELSSIRPGFFHCTPTRAVGRASGVYGPLVRQWSAGPPPPPWPAASWISLRFRSGRPSPSGTSRRGGGWPGGWAAGAACCPGTEGCGSGASHHANGMRCGCCRTFLGWFPWFSKEVFHLYRTPTMFPCMRNL